VAIIYTCDRTGVQTDKRVERHVEIREQLCPEGMVEVDVYHPCGSVTPWDYHGGKHQREYMTVLRAAGIESFGLTTNKKLLCPSGTGPGGSVRMGDNMTPGVYRIAVKTDEAGKAAQAFAAHKEAIRAWLDDGAAMPEACR
jgi:hypothetical protein